MRVQERYLLVAVTLALFAFCADPARGQSRVSSRAAQLWPSRAQRLQSILIQGVKFSANWSLEEAEKIKDFFLEKFGHALPVSAMGQTAVHDRLKYDHHDAMDVALHPDSKEGRALIAYLRQTGTPFIAFRRKIAGLATGPHIHIGNRSPKLEVVPVVRADSTQPSEAVGVEILQNH